MDRLAPFRGDAFDKPPCRGCSSYLMEPYIKCADCGPPEFLLCLQCFSRGFEYKKHQSDHNYEIMTSDFPVLDPSWTAQEEMAVLEAVMDCGFGNWQEVAIQMRTKTKDDCENHYMKHFINNPLFASTLLSMKQAEEDKNAETAVPFQASEDPPRPTFDSLLSRDMAGYMPARADFIEEFDNYAEWDLRDIDFVEDDSEILHALKIAVVDIYHSRLKERQRRKRIIREHGLINLRKFQILERRYSKDIQELYETMRRFGRILGARKHDRFIESHALEFDLRREIKWLQEYRTAGITSFQSSKIYYRLKKSREEERLKRNMLSEVLQYIHDGNACQQWLKRQAAIDAGLHQIAPIISSSGRRSAPPLDLTGLPGTEKLNDKEKEDNDPKHTSRLCKDYLTKKESDGVLRQITWSPQSPDLNPIEMVWGELDRRVKAKGPTSAKHLWELLQDCWKTIPGDYLLKLIKRMPRVCKAVIKAKDGYFEEPRI
ncbi:transcriptional adapter 2-alpha isoform X4 [Ranitomeya imitator]|uniref:transcriptional adapter 2-alpha isoform X4 n=1 Tax=Ranitomeya imitator TaxID=111125 RepID=UPI0037E93B54